jgi:uncharacterized protein (TIGR02266 family)
MAKPRDKGKGGKWRKLVGDLQEEARQAEESGLTDPNLPRRRGEPRVPISVRIALQFESMDEVIENKTLDLSSKGCFIRTRDVQPEGTPLKLRLNIGSRAVYLDGIVAHSVPPDDDAMTIPGMGIEFTDLDETGKAFIENVLGKFRRSIR